MTATQNPAQNNVRDIINKYSPLVKGREGLLGISLKIIGRPLEWAYNAGNAVMRFPFYFGYENTAGQYVGDCPAIIPATLSRMEKKLQASFQKAAAKEAAQPERLDFLSLAQEVEADTAILSKHFNVSHGIFGTAPDSYTFIVQQTGNGEALQQTTLQEGIVKIETAAGLRRPEPPAFPVLEEPLRNVQKLRL